MVAGIATANGETQPKTSPEIRTGPVVKRAFTNNVAWTGIVQSQAAVTLTTTLSGRIDRIAAKDETAVKKGAVLFQLGGTRIDAERTRLTSEVDGLQIQLKLAHQTVEQTQKDLNDHLATKNQLAAAQQSEITLKTRLQQARLARDSFEQQTRIVAPMDGVFTARHVSDGQQVNAGDPIAELVNTRHLRIAASLFPPDGAALLNQPATVRITDDKTIGGKVVHVLPRRSKTGAIMIWIEGPEIDQTLQPGQNASGRLFLNSNATTAVPKSSVVYDDQEEAFVFVPTGGKYERRRVRTGQTADGWVEILSGLKPGEKIVTQGAYELFYSDFTQQYKVQD